jgi:hypothetical protein
MVVHLCLHPDHLARLRGPRVPKAFNSLSANKRGVHTSPLLQSPFLFFELPINSE